MIRLVIKFLQRPRSQQSGFSIVELAIVLGVAGVVMGGVWVTIQKGSIQARTKQAVMQIITLNRNIRNFYQKQACIAATGDRTADLMPPNANPTVIPRDMLVAGGAVHPWDQPFFVLRVGAAGCGAAGSFQYTLRYQGLPPDVCIAFVTRAASPGESARGLAGASINAVALATLPPNPTAITGNAAGQCGQNATATVDFLYNLRVTD